MLSQYIVCGRYKLALWKKPLIMGILNVTPDSFYDAGLYLNTTAACKRALQIKQEGADIIDVGGESSRPGAKAVTADEEAKRTIPVIARLSKKINLPISIDTSKPYVAKLALEAGACIINDITGLQNPEMAKLASKHKAAVIIMHMKGNPGSMQNTPRYKNLLKEIKAKLNIGITNALKNGIKKNSIIIDPGIGFGKNLRHNLTIIRKIPEFKKLGYPVLIGLSRKSFIGKLLNLDIKDRLIPTIACNAVALINGAGLIRAHDVKEAVWTRDIVCKLKNLKK